MKTYNWMATDHNGFEIQFEVNASSLEDARNQAQKVVNKYNYKHAILL